MYSDLMFIGVETWPGNTDIILYFNISCLFYIPVFVIILYVCTRVFNLYLLFIPFSVNISMFTLRGAAIAVPYAYKSATKNRTRYIRQKSYDMCCSNGNAIAFAV